MLIQNKWFSQQWCDIILFTACFIIIYSLFAGSHPLFVNDEGRYNEVAREMFFMHNFITPTNNFVLFFDKPPLFYWLQSSSFWLFGINEWAVRIWPMIFAWFGCIVTYMTGFYLYGRRAAWLSAAILATSPLYFVYAHYANLDLEVAVLVAASLMGFMMAIRDGIDKVYLKPMLFAYVCAALAFMTKGLLGLVFPLMIIGAWIICFRAWRVLRHMYIGWGILIVLAICLPWLIIMQIHNPEFFHYFFYVQQFERYTGSQFNNPEPITFYLMAIIIGFLPWALWLLQSIYMAGKKVRFEGDTLAGFLLLWIGLITIFFSIPTSKINSYILPVFPGLALVVGRYVAEKNLTEKYWQWLFYLVSLFILVSGVILAFLPNSLFHHYDLSHHAQRLGAVILLCMGLFYFCLFYFTTPLQRWQSIIIFMAVGLVFLSLTESAFHYKPTIKPLVMLIKNQLQPTDEIVSYYNFYYDLPFYTQRRVTVVAAWNDPVVIDKDSWGGQMAALLAYQPQAREWLIGDAQFWQQWNSSHRLYVFLYKTKLATFEATAKPSTVYILGEYDRNYLVSNQP